MDQFSELPIDHIAHQESLPTREPLSGQEQLVIDSSMRYLKRTEDLDPQAWRLKHMATRRILRMGNRALPYLKEHFFDQETTPDAKYFVSAFTSALAEREDLPLVLSCMKETVSAESTDVQVRKNFEEALRRIIYEIRKEKPHDPQLIRIGSTLVSTIHYLTDPFVRDAAYETLALTGTENARQFINDHRDEITSPSTSARAFEAVRELPGGTPIRGYDLRGDMEAVQSGSTAVPSHQPITGTTPETSEERDLDEVPKLPLPKSLEGMSEDELTKLCETVTDIVQRFERISVIPKSVRPLLTLRAFNILRERPDATAHDIIKYLGRLQYVLKAERDAMRSDLPSIGIEVEVPQEYFPTSYNPDTNPIFELLTKNGLKIKKEVAGTEHKPSEFVFPPSYSALAQNALLFELRKAGFIPTDNTFASLHINLAKETSAETYEEVSESAIENHPPHEEQPLAFAISDILTYAFVPEGRVRSRKNLYSVLTNVAEPVSTSDTSYLLRYEFRTPRVFGPKTYHLLREAQAVGTLLTSDDVAFENLKRDFLQDVTDLRKRYELGELAPSRNQFKAADAIDKAWKQKRAEQAREQKAIAGITDPAEKKDKLSELKKLREPNLIDDARSLMWKYAHAVLEKEKGWEDMNDWLESPEED